MARAWPASPTSATARSSTVPRPSSPTTPSTRTRTTTATRRTSRASASATTRTTRRPGKQARTAMTSTLILRDLSVSKDLDGKTMSTVRGGDGNQANGIAQQNLQEMLAAVNVGNGLKVGNNSPVIIQSDNSFD